MKAKNESKLTHATELKEVEKMKKGLLVPSEKKKSTVQTLFYGGLKQIKDINR